MKLKIVLICTLICILSYTPLYAYRITEPLRITDFDQRGLVIVNDTFQKLWDITNGRYNADVVTTAPTEDATEGDFRFYHSGNQKRLYSYINGSWSYIAIDSEVYDDVRVSGLAMRTNATAPDLIAFAPAATTLLTYGFDGTGTDEQAYFAIQLPHSYKEGTDIYPHVHWTPTDANAGTVVWTLEYTWINRDATASAPTTIKTTAVNAGGVAWVHKYSDFTDISGTGKKISSMLMCRLTRLGADDTYAHDAALLEVDFHFVIDSLGSIGELVK